MSVYFLNAGRYIKVGWSRNPERRMANLWASPARYSRPYDLSLRDDLIPLLVIDGDNRTERVCHEALADYAAGNEWFIDEPPVREFMARVKSGDFSPASPREGGSFERERVAAMVAQMRVKFANCGGDFLFDHIPRRCGCPWDEWVAEGLVPAEASVSLDQAVTP